MNRTVPKYSIFILYIFWLMVHAILSQPILKKHVYTIRSTYIEHVI